MPSLKVPSLKELDEANLSTIQKHLNERTPPHDKAFTRVLSVVQTMGQAGLYRYARDLVRQSFVTTATGASLRRLGDELGVAYRGAEKAILEVEVAVVDPDAKKVRFDRTTVLKEGDRNYAPEVSSVIVRESAPGERVVVFSIASTEAGSIFTLPPGAKLKISGPPQLSKEAVVARVTREGRDAEDEEEYRARVLVKKRFPRGGGAISDYRMGASRVPGVRRVYPFTGDLTGDTPDYAPPHRTVFVEVDRVEEERLYGDSGERQKFLDTVSRAMRYGSDGRLTEPLGMNFSTLHVELCTRIPFFVEVSLSQRTRWRWDLVEKSISAALEKYFSSRCPFIEGGDTEQARADTVSVTAIAASVAPFLGGVEFGEIILQMGSDSGKSVLPGDFYRLKENEVARFHGVRVS